MTDERSATATALPPVVLVHGFATPARRTWIDNGWVDLLRESGRDVIVPDLPGHGEGAKSHDPADYDQMHRALLDVLPDEPVDAVGFSLGSRLLMLLATEEPQRFRQLVLTGTGEDLLRTHDYTTIVAALTGDETHVQDSPVHAYFAQLASAPGADPQALAAVLRRPSNKPFTADQLAGATCPITLVVGDRDFAGPAEPVAALLPHASVVSVRGVDHFSTPKSFDVLDVVLGLLASPAPVV